MVSLTTMFRTSAEEESGNSRNEPANANLRQERSSFIDASAYCRSKPGPALTSARLAHFFLGLFRFRPARQSGIPGNQPGSTFKGEIRPGPLDQYYQSVAKPDQEENVNEQPGQPGEES